MNPIPPVPPTSTRPEPVSTEETKMLLYRNGPLFDESVAFYARMLGLEPFLQWNHRPRDRGCIFDLGSSKLELIDSDRRPPGLADFAVSLRVCNVLFLREDLQCKTSQALRTIARPWGHTGFKLVDPAGLSLTFFTPTDALHAGKTGSSKEK